MIEYLNDKGRDHALLSVGILCTINKDMDSKIKEGYAPAFEGPVLYRSLPFVQAFGVKIYYKER